MEKVAIVTIESFNYGNRLQNYALQEVLKSMGYVVRTVHRIYEPKTVKIYVKRMVQNVLQTKAAKFRKFDKKIEFSNVVLKRDEYPIGLEDRFNYFIVGSDQVWNPHYDFVAGKCDFLTFARNNQKISYAASFGVNEIPYERKFEFAEYLKNFKAISVREKQ